nr:hypothetical protein [Tanacetum cinerariifolium]
MALAINVLAMSIEKDDKDLMPTYGSLRGASRFLAQHSSGWLNCNKNLRLCRAKGSPVPHLESTYDKADGSVIINLLQKINNVKQVKCSCAASSELVLHQQLMKFMHFLMGHDDCYEPNRSALLTRDPLHKSSSSLSSGFTSEEMQKLLSLARLVAEGFSQGKGFDYDENFSPIMKMVAVRCFISIVVVSTWHLYQLDVNNAFFYGDLVEDFYMPLHFPLAIMLHLLIGKNLSHGIRGMPEYIKKASVNFLTDPLDGRSTLKPADILIIGWVGGRHVCTDLTGVSLLVGLSATLVEEDDEDLMPTYGSLRGASRFLVPHPSGLLKCNKNPRLCRARGSRGPNCCNKKCVNVKTDKQNFGLCGKKCKHQEICCKGKCVNVMKDKRHCGWCDNRCKKGNTCVYGMCSYV